MISVASMCVHTNILQQQYTLCNIGMLVMIRHVVGLVFGDGCRQLTNVFYAPSGVVNRQKLAVALSQNSTLTSLDLSYNSVTPAAAMVLAYALKVRAFDIGRHQPCTEKPGDELCPR